MFDRQQQKRLGAAQIICSLIVPNFGMKTKWKTAAVNRAGWRLVQVVAAKPNEINRVRDKDGDRGRWSRGVGNLARERDRRSQRRGASIEGRPTDYVLVW